MVPGRFIWRKANFCRNKSISPQSGEALIADEKVSRHAAEEGSANGLGMRTILGLFIIVAVAVLQSGCSAGASVGHEGHRHGVSAGATTSGPGAGVGVRAY